jgi:peptide/nickel transport system substrate-binding protein
VHAVVKHGRPDALFHGHPLRRLSAIQDTGYDESVNLAGTAGREGGDMDGPSGRGHQRRSNQAVGAILLGVGVLLAACGGSTKKTSAPEVQTSTTATTTRAQLSPQNLPPAIATTSTAAVPVTTSTVKATATTAAKKGTTATTVGKGVTKGPQGGISNVVSETTAAPRVDIQPGGTVTYLKASDITGFDPIVLNTSGVGDGAPAYMVMDMLVSYDPKEGVVKPRVAESLTSNDALVWTLKLRPNVKFTDGTAYDAAAVKFNWLRLADPNNRAVRAAQAAAIQTMDVIDATTLKITLKGKNAVFPQAVTLIAFIGSPQAIQQKGSGFMSDPVGAGPFLLKSWVRDSQMVFVRNPNYWNAPRPYVDQVIAKPIVDESQRINTFIAGDANFMAVGTAQNADRVTKANAGVTYTQIQNGGLNIYFQTRRGPFADIRARQAVAMAIDRVDYAKVVNGGLQEPLDSIFRHDSPFFDPSVVQLGYDPVKAQQIFDQLATETGGPLKATITAFPAQNYATSAQYVQGTLNKFRNVNISIVTEASTLHNTNCPRGDFDAICGYGNNFDDPEPAWTGFFTCNAPSSPTGWCNTKFDAAVTQNQVSLDPATRIAAIREAQRQFYNDVPGLYLERRYSWLFGASNVQDVRWVNDNLPIFDEMWIKTHS